MTNEPIEPRAWPLGTVRLRGRAPRLGPNAAFVSLLIAWLAASGLSAAPASGMPDPAAEALFRRDPGWLGADAVYSVPLGPGRVLWLFGDTFLAGEGGGGRHGARIVRNTIAIQEGLDPAQAKIRFFHGTGRDRSPDAFFPGRNDRWYWPGHGIRLQEGPLVIFLYEMEATPGNSLGFRTAGYAVAIVQNPDASPAEWNVRISEGPGDGRVIPATAVVREGGFVIALAIRQEGIHAGALVRFPVARLVRGDLSGAEWWNGEGWVPPERLGSREPAFVIDDAGSECSLERDEKTGRFFHVASYGFGASTIGIRTAPSLTGPWSRPRTIHRPKESDEPRPFVYAAKAHPWLKAPDGGLAVSYIASSLEFQDLFDREHDLYWPRFILISEDELPGR